MQKVCINESLHPRQRTLTALTIMAEVSANCNIVPSLLKNSDVIGKMIFDKRTGHDHMWNEYTEKVDLDTAMGLNQRYSIVQRVRPPTLVMSSVSDLSAANRSCNPPLTQVEWPGTQAKAIDMQIGDLNAPPLCLQDLMYSANAPYIVDAFVDGLSDATGFIMMDQIQTRYTNNAGNKVVVRNGTAAADPVSSGLTFPAVAATGTLTYNRFKQAWVNLQYKAQGQAPAQVGGNNIYTVFLSWEARENLIRQDQSIREDIRFGDPVMLLNPMGQQVETYRDFIFETIMYPKRWNFVSGTWIEVRPFGDGSSTPTTIGNDVEVSPDYLNATYEDAYIFNTMAYKLSVPNLPKLSWGNNRIKYEPQNYMGTWKFINTPSIVCADGSVSATNAFGDQVFPFARFELGDVAPRPELAYVFRYRRCGFGNDSITCST